MRAYADTSFLVQLIAREPSTQATLEGLKVVTIADLD